MEERSKEEGSNRARGDEAWALVLRAFREAPGRRGKGCALG